MLLPDWLRGATAGTLVVLDPVNGGRLDERCNLKRAPHKHGCLVRMVSTLEPYPEVIAHVRDRWLAVVEPDGAAPGGMTRRFLAKSRGEDTFYLVRDLEVGQLLELACDRIWGDERKRRPCTCDLSRCTSMPSRSKFTTRYATQRSHVRTQSRRQT